MDLQEGFVGDLVIVRVNDQEVFRKEGVKTNMMLGRAGFFELQIPEGQVAVDVALPSRNLSKRINLSISAPIHLGISIEENEITHILSQEPFRYY